MTERSFDFSLPALLGLAWVTIQKPRVVARQVADLRLEPSTMWLMLLMLATVSVLLGQGSALILTPEAQNIDNAFLTNPLLMAGIQWAVLFLTVFAVHWIGGLMGGRGVFEDSLAAMTWLQFVMLCVQVAQTAALVVAPIIAELITLVGLVLFLWLFTSFVAEVHGFDNLALVFVMILVSGFAISFALTLVLAMLGLTVTGGAGVS